MTIRSKLTTIALIPLFLALVVIATIFWTSKEMQRARAADRSAYAITTSVFELNLTTDQYLRQPDVRPKLQFRSIHESLKKDLALRGNWNQQEEDLITRMRESHQAMGELFSLLVSLGEQKGSGKENSESAELRERAVAQLLANSRQIVTDSVAFSRASAMRLDAAQRRGSYLILLIVSFSAAGTLILARLTTISVLQPINNLEDGARKIANGNLNHRIETGSRDEIGRLAHTFNDMTAKLGQSYVSIGVLEEEITDRRRTEQALRHAEEELRKSRDELELRVQERTEALRRQADLIELTHEAIIVKDLESRILFWSLGAEETYGWTKAEAGGDIIHSFLRTRFPLPFDEYVAALISVGRWEGELIHTRKDGSELTVLSRQVLQCDEAGTPIAVMEINIDITERKQAEIDLQASEERWATTLASIGDAVIATDTSGRITFMNAVAEALTGWTFGDAVPKPLTEVFRIINEQTRLKVENPIARVLREGMIVGLANHTLLVKKDGTEVPIDDSGAPVRDKQGKTTGVVLVFRDITDRKQTEERLQHEANERSKIEEQLRQAQKMEALGTMSGGIAHDFNNILAAIIGFTELVADRVPKESREAHHLKRVMESSLRGRDLVRQMLTFSRKAEQQKKPLSLSGIVKETVKLIRATTPTTISIRVGTLSESVLIFGDPTQMQQVLMNLCTNAVYAMQELGGSLDINLNEFNVSSSDGNPHGIKPGHYVRLTVRDTGAGMPPDIMEKIFDPFFTTKKLGEGTGLGLSVVHGIVKQHDGYITVESKPGQGSIFTVYFPQVSGELETDEVSDGALPTGTERILFVDDEEALVEMGEDILAELGYEVTSRMNGREALALFKSDPSRFDLVITDQTMPEMTGVELAREILALRHDIPIIMCTGFSHVVDADKAEAAGIKAFAMKPLTKREIARTIRRVLDE